MYDDVTPVATPTGVSVDNKIHPTEWAMPQTEKIISLSSLYCHKGRSLLGSWKLKKIIMQPLLENILPRCFWQWYSVTEYFIGWLISSFLIKSCKVKKSFEVCAQIGRTNIIDAFVLAYTIQISGTSWITLPWCKEDFLNRQIVVIVILFSHLQ